MTSKNYSIRDINNHLASGSHYCYVGTPGGRRYRISRVRTRKGVREGRIINGSEKDWEPLPPGTVFELV